MFVYPKAKPKIFCKSIWRASIKNVMSYNYGAIKSHKSHIFSVLHEAMKRILKQKLHPCEVYNKIYKVIKTDIFHVRS